MPVLKILKQHRMLLDTHVLLWYVAKSDTLKTAFLTILNNAPEGNILISPMTIWEVSMLLERKRIELEMDVGEWAERVFSHPSVSQAPFTPEIAILSNRLPNGIHGDPVDRILVATSHLSHSVLVTADTKILEYGKGQLISVYNPT
jgi:PIN domain nuclease of toxin-antitoxin system